MKRGKFFLVGVVSTIMLTVAGTFMAAYRYLAGIPDPPTGPAHRLAAIAHRVLGSQHRLAYSGGWRMFDADDQVRIAVGEYLTAHQ